MSALDLNDQAQNMRAFFKARASLDGADAVTWFSGSVSAMIPGEPWRGPLFGFEGFNVARAVEIDGGYELLSREAAFYLDPRSRAVLRTWTNPFTQTDREVVHVWNDPVNFRFTAQGPRGPFMVPWREAGGRVFFLSDVFLAYPSPLPRAEFPESSQNDTYQAAELFGFTCARADLEDGAPSAPATISWTRIAPWLPFMGMADRPGQLVYHCEGLKLGSFDELPGWIRDEVAAHGEQFAHAPETWSEPSETSWTYFKKLATRA
ncbi:MAG TPA: DUF1838 family protein [Actinomycetota bacterium]